MEPTGVVNGDNHLQLKHFLGIILGVPTRPTGVNATEVDEEEMRRLKTRAEYEFSHFFNNILYSVSLALARGTAAKMVAQRNLMVRVSY